MMNSGFCLVQVHPPGLMLLLRSSWNTLGWLTKLLLLLHLMLLSLKLIFLDLGSNGGNGLKLWLQDLLSGNEQLSRVLDVEDDRRSDVVHVPHGLVHDGLLSRMLLLLRLWLLNRLELLVGNRRLRVLMDNWLRDIVSPVCSWHHVIGISWVIFREVDSGWLWFGWQRRSKNALKFLWPDLEDWRVIFDWEILWPGLEVRASIRITKREDLLSG